MTYSSDAKEIEIEVRAKDAVRLLNVVDDYIIAAKNMGIVSEYDGMKPASRERHVRKLFRECYRLKTPNYYDEDIKAFFDRAEELMRGNEI